MHLAAMVMGMDGLIMFGSFFHLAMNHFVICKYEFVVSVAQ